MKGETESKKVLWTNKMFYTFEEDFPTAEKIIFVIFFTKKIIFLLWGRKKQIFLYIVYRRNCHNWN